MAHPSLSLLPILALFPTLLWWAGTGLVLRNAHAERAFGPMAAWSAALPFALAGLVYLSGRPQSAGGVLASYALVFVVWAWLEVSFYTGYVTGPVKVACPPGAGAARRLVHGLGASAWHELAMVVLGAGLWLVADGAARWAPAFYLVLAAMHTSARLNVLLGVRNLNEHFLPQRLAYLRSLFRQRPMNGLMPISIMTCVALTGSFGVAALGANGGEAAGLVVLTALSGLGLVEHLMLVLPLPGHRLFEWGLPSQQG